MDKTGKGGKSKKGRPLGYEQPGFTLEFQAQ